MKFELDKSLDRVISDHGQQGSTGGEAAFEVIIDEINRVVDVGGIIPAHHRTVDRSSRL